MVEVVIGDGRPLFADLLGAALTDRGYVVVHTALGARSLVDAVRRRRPDVCLVDHRSLGGRDRGRLIENLRDAGGDRTRIIVVSAGPSGPAADTAAGLGVDGVLDKRDTLTHLLVGLRRVLDGERVAVPQARDEWPPDAECARLHRLAADLTSRERECLALLVDGRTTGHIGSALSISVATVRSHVRSLLHKLGVHSRLEAASLATRYDLLSDDLGASRVG